jgi:hypothetical protein
VADVKAAARELTLPRRWTRSRELWRTKRRRGVQGSLRRLQFSIEAGQAQQTVSANVSLFDRMTDDEQKTMLAALKALKGD